MHGWEHTGHLHRPALLLPARIRDHRHLGRTARGCAGEDGHPGQPPRLPQGHPAGSGHPSQAQPPMLFLLQTPMFLRSPSPEQPHPASLIPHSPPAQPHRQCQHPVHIIARQGRDPPATLPLPPSQERGRKTGIRAAALSKSHREGSPHPPCPQGELPPGIPAPSKQRLGWVQGHSPGRARGLLRAQEQLSLLENSTFLLGK